VNYELPNVPEDYVHRIGRTGRAGNEGEACSLVSIDENKLLRDIERLIKREIPKKIIDGFEPDPTIKPEPVKKSGGQRTRSKRTNNSTQRPGKNSRRRNNKRSAGSESAENNQQRRNPGKKSS